MGKEYVTSLVRADEQKEESTQTSSVSLVV
jgi:hypothetical protein